MAGKKHKAKGSLKEAAGKMAGDRRTEAEGKTDRVQGEAKEVPRACATACASADRLRVGLLALIF